MPVWVTICALVCAAATAVHRLVIAWTKRWGEQRRAPQSEQSTERQLDNFVLISASCSGVVLSALMGLMFLLYGVPNVSATFWPWIGLAGLIQFVGLTQGTAAFARGNLSTLLPLNALLPVGQTGLALMLRGEWPSHRQLSGILVVALGMLLSALGKGPGPEGQDSKPQDVTPASSWVGRAYQWTQASAKRQYAIALTTWPLYAFALKPALASMSPRTPAMPFVGASMVMAVMALLGVVQCLYLQRKQERKRGLNKPFGQTVKAAAGSVRQELVNRTSLVLFALGALIVGGQQFCDLMAYANAKIALVASLMETSIVFNIPAILLFPKLEQYLTRRLKLESEPAPGERLTKTNWAVAIVVTAGAILIGG